VCHSRREFVHELTLIDLELTYICKICKRRRVVNKIVASFFPKAGAETSRKFISKSSDATASARFSFIYAVIKVKPHVFAQAKINFIGRNNLYD